jgi:hypothetical protein
VTGVSAHALNDRPRTGSSGKDEGSDACSAGERPRTPPGEPGWAVLGSNQ